MKSRKMNNSSTTAKNRRLQPAGLALLGALMLATLASVAIPASATTIANLAGPWQATVYGQGSGCGVGTKLLTFTLNSSGEATNAVWSYHTVSCSNFTETGGTFTITALNPDGAGTAQLVVGGTTFNFDIQVAPSHQVFNLVDITDTGSYEEGTAVKQ